MRERKEFVLNVHYIRICKCCASCAHKEITRERLTRWCKWKKTKVKPCQVCPQWEMSEIMMKAGLSSGVVRDKVTKEVLLN